MKDNRKPPPPGSSGDDVNNNNNNNNVDNSIKKKRRASGGLSTPRIDDNSDHRNQRGLRSGGGSSRTTSMRGIDVDDDSGPFQPPSRGGIPTPYHHPTPNSTTNRNSNDGMYYHQDRGGPGAGAGAGGKVIRNHHRISDSNDDEVYRPHQPPDHESNRPLQKQPQTLRRSGSEGLISLESIRNNYNDLQQQQQQQQQQNQQRRRQQQPRQRPERQQNRRNRNSRLDYYDDPVLYSPPQQRQRPPPNEGRPLPRTTSSYYNNENFSTYNINESESLGPLRQTTIQQRSTKMQKQPAPPPTQSQQIQQYRLSNDTYAVDTMLYETASIVEGGPDYFYPDGDDTITFVDGGDAATTSSPSTARRNPPAAGAAQYPNRGRGGGGGSGEGVTPTTGDGNDNMSRYSSSRGPSLPGYNSPRSRRTTATTTIQGDDGYDGNNVNNRNINNNGTTTAPPQSKPSDTTAYKNEEFFDDDDFDFELFQLSELCATSGRLELNGAHTEDDYIEHDLSWNPVREWLQNHSPEHVFPYLQARDEYGKTALHFACQHQPPMDIMEYLMHVILNSGDASLLEAQDAFLWSPLHYACAFAAPMAVLQSLAEYRDSAKLLSTNKGLTPLHLALIGPIRDAPDIIAILASNGATKIADQQGLLPIHYACAFGACEESLRVLIDIYPDGLVTADNFGRNPLHFALANTKTNPKAAPVTVRLLLTLRPGLVNPKQDDDGPNPFLFLLEYATQINSRHPDQALQDSIQKCLNLLLDANPNPTPTVFTALRSLPYWLFPTAILSPTVQDLLNEKIKGRFPTVILMLDFYVQIVVLVFYFICVDNALEDRNCISDADMSIHAKQEYLRNEMNEWLTFPLFVGASYFLLREVVQVVSLVYLKSVRTLMRVWILHMSDWLDLSYIGVVYLWGILILCGKLTDTESFAIGAAVSAGILWGKLFLYLRSASFDFSIFVSGVFYVFSKLVPYTIVLTSFFIAFSQMFYTLFSSNKDYGCIGENGEQINNCVLELDDFQCGNFEAKLPFCERWDSFLRVYTMFLGEVDDDDFKASRVAVIFFSFFMFLMVILLATVLIAIVTDRYKYIQDREATLVFYTNRLYFLAETDAIGSCFNMFGSKEGRELDHSFRKAWQTLLFAFELGPNETIGSAQFWKFRFVPMIVACFIIPSWFLLGIVTCGAVWPPQIRAWLLTANTHRRKQNMAQLAEEQQSLRRQEESYVEAQVIKTRDEFYQSLAENRQQLSQIKAAIAERKQEIRKEMKRIKIIMGNLLEQAEQSDDDDDDYYDD